MPPHECVQKKNIDDVTTQCDRIEKEIYVGREGRQPVLVRVDRCERIVNALTYISTALLVTVLAAVGSVLWQSVVRGARGQHVSSARYEADFKGGSRPER